MHDSSEPGCVLTDQRICNITAAGAVDREFYSGFCGISILFPGFWGPGGVPAARPQNSASDGLRESPR